MVRSAVGSESATKCCAGNNRHNISFSCFLPAGLGPAVLAVLLRRGVLGVRAEKGSPGLHDDDWLTD